MKRYSWLLLLTAPLIGQGCLGMEKMFEGRESAGFKEAEKAPASLPPVTADDVTADNATTVAEDLLPAELDRAAKEPVVQPLTAHVQPK